LTKEALEEHFFSHQPDILFFKVVNTRNDEVIGHMEFSEINSTEKSAILSRVLIGTEFRGQGFGKNLLEKAIAYAKNELKLETLNLTVFSFNQKAISLYEYLGFETTGIEENYINIAGDFWHRKAMRLQF
jgi:RimJ/RimL family protein N-acetyltransferase